MTGGIKIRRTGALSGLDLAAARADRGGDAAGLDVVDSRGGADGSGEPDRSPLGQLRTALDGLVDAGVLAPERREGAEYPIWAAVHGMAVLAGRGPMRGVPEEGKRRLEELTLGFIEQALTRRMSAPGQVKGL